MCIFTGPIIDVKGTRIFARVLEGDRQLVVYDMAFSAASDLAMVLPIPVREGSGDDAVRFVDLSHLPAFFDRLDSAFGASRTMGLGAAPGAGPYRAPPLVVHKVGMFEASYVPSRAEFSRLDPRFRLDESVLEALGARGTYGFVVVKLAKAGDVTRVHPIAFSYPSRAPARVFFPTVHVHDGRVHSAAAFDHALYTTDARRAAIFGAYGLGAEGAELPAAASTEAGAHSPFYDSWLTTALDHELCGVEGTVVLAPRERVYRRELAGLRVNDDAWVETEAGPTPAEVVAVLTREVAAGRTPLGLEWALFMAHRTGGFLRGLRALFGGGVSAERVSALRITAPERAIESGAVFRVHARGAGLRGPSDVPGKNVGSVLCGLLHPTSPTEPAQIHPLDSPRALDEWVARGGQATAEELAWLRRAS